MKEKSVLIINYKQKSGNKTSKNVEFSKKYFMPKIKAKRKNQLFLEGKEA
ncbi:MAG: hypothetical protein IJE65_05910 [Clostridia bacterium]|nr:hypothetical protein [Clostridia bacterium]